MIQSKVYNIIIGLFWCTQVLFSQAETKGIVTDKVTNKPISGVQIYSKSLGTTVYSNGAGKFSIQLEEGDQVLAFIELGYEILETTINSTNTTYIKVQLQPLSEQLNEVLITQQREKVFGIKKLKNVEGTAIYAGKKTEVVLVEQLVSNKASGNPRQAFAQVAGLNIFETEDAGLQLNIGGRGLDPNRSANFNTRQNGYDISADVLGYPESYYTPPLEALDEIQVVRGAASLQYGTQFGGLVNFKLKQPNPKKELELITRQGIGSFGLINSFTSLSGTIDKFSYYTYFQHKEGDGFRPNSDFDSQNFYANLGYQFTPKTKVTLESTYLTYLAKQAGGLSDDQFEEDPFVSLRPRNYFQVNWLLLNLKLEHEFSKKIRASLNVFTLDASRTALGFREGRASIEDDFEIERELLIDEFNNWGAEGRVLTRYNLLGKNAVLLLGAKYYQSANRSQQGIGPDGGERDFSFQEERFPNSELTESDFDFPNLNLSLFGEHIFNISNTFTVTPGFRYEYIKTESDGFLVEKDRTSQTTVNRLDPERKDFKNERDFLLLGLGLSYKPSKLIEAFANFSQNYRSVTFNEIRIDRPRLTIDEDITDETGFTFDVGVRGEIDDIIRYDISGYSLLYDNRIDEARPIDGREVGAEDRDNVIFRTNVGSAQIFGIESLITANFSNWFFADNSNFHWQQFLNTSYTTSEYSESFLSEEAFQENNIVGNEVGFVPKLNLKTGLELGYRNFKSSFQYTYVSTQFSEALNSPITPPSGGLFGEIPAYSVVDFSSEFTYKKWKLEAGINNLLNERYFTRRATGYPGPGIIPSAPRSFYAVLQFKF